MPDSTKALLDQKKINIHNLPRKNTAFYENSDNLLLFQKIRPYKRDINFDKQVHNYHFMNKLKVLSENESTLYSLQKTETNDDNLDSQSTHFSEYIDFFSAQSPTTIKNFDQECISDLLSATFLNHLYTAPITEPNAQCISPPKNVLNPETRSFGFLATLQQYGCIEFEK